MIFLDVPEMRWDETQLLYHTLGRMGVEALALTRTVEPYVCVGFSQSISGEVDEEYCGREGIGVFRRELGGGTVYIDREQLLIQLVLRRDSPGLPAGQVNFFKRFLSPLVEVYRKLGLEAVFRPTCDLLVNGRKISGTGGGEVGDCAVMATNVLIDFDYERMSRVLRCPSEEFRALLRKAMERGITSLRAELGRAPEWRKLRRMVREAFEALLGPMEETELGSGDGGAGGDTGVGGGRGDRDEGAAAGEGREGRARGRGAGGSARGARTGGEMGVGGQLLQQLRREMDGVRRELFSRKWLESGGAGRPWREVKVRELNYVVQLPFEGSELLIDVEEGRIASVQNLSAPGEGGWWDRLVGVDYCPEEILNIVSRMAGRR